MSPSPSVNTKWGDAKHLTRALFDQGDIWVTAMSQVVKVEDMSATHVLNTLLMIERMDDLPIDNLQDTKLYQALYDRLLSFLPKEVKPSNEAPTGPIWPHGRPLSKRVGIDRESIESILEAAVAANEHAPPGRAREVVIDYMDANGITTRGRRIIPKLIFRGTPERRDAVALSAYDLDKRKPRRFLIERILLCEEA